MRSGLSTEPIKRFLGKLSTVAVLGAMAWQVAWAAQDAKRSVTWNFAFPGEAANASPTLDEVLASARAARRPVMIDFSAEWCAACRLLDRNTYTAPDVVEQASRFVTVRIDVTNAGGATEDLARRFGVVGLPTVIFVSSRGAVLASSTVLGLADAATLSRTLRKIP